MLYNAVGLGSVPLQTVRAYDRFLMGQHSVVVLTRERTRRAPNVRYITLHFHIFVLNDVRPTTTNDDFIFQSAHVFDRIILLVDNLSDERVVASWQDEMVLLTEESL